MNQKQAKIPLPGGAQAMLSIPEPVTLERIGIVEDALSAFFRVVRGEAQPQPGRDSGAIEYDSWRDAGAIEYDSWRAA
jgi:hypothetical protein